jgi:hypothetical protein
MKHLMLSAVSARYTWCPSRSRSHSNGAGAQARGRIAILTNYARKAAPIRHALTADARAIGLTMFDRHIFVDLFWSAGLVDVEQQTQRALRFVATGKPDWNGRRLILRLGGGLADAEDPNHRGARFTLQDPRIAALDGLRYELELHGLAGPMGHLRAFDLE